MLPVPGVACLSPVVVPLWWSVDDLERDRRGRGFGFGTTSSSPCTLRLRGEVVVFPSALLAEEEGVGVGISNFEGRAAGFTLSVNEKETNYDRLKCLVFRYFTGLLLNSPYSRASRRS